MEVSADKTRFIQMIFQKVNRGLLNLQCQGSMTRPDVGLHGGLWVIECTEEVAFAFCDSDA